MENEKKTKGSARRKLRLGLLLAVVAVGTGSLALSQRIAARLDRLVAVAVDGGGRRVVIANANLRADSSFDWQMPPTFTTDDLRTLLDAGAGVRNASIVNELPWRQIEVEGVAYRPGTVLGSDERYPDVMGLSFVAGSFFSAQDVSSRAKTAAISERAAVILYGDAASAVGKSFRADRNIFVIRRAGGAPSERQESSFDSYTISGVYRDVTEFERDAFDIPDYIIPYTTMFPEGMSRIPFVRTFAARVDSRDLSQVEAGLRSSLAQAKDDEVKLTVWEGSLGFGGATSVDRVRRSLKSLSLVAQLFGLAILAVASFGIVSAMMAEAAERKREFAIKRALGLTAFGAALELCAGGVRLAAFGALFGFAVATAAGNAAVASLSPFLEALGVSGGDLGGGFLEPRTLLAPLSAVAFAALFSLLPALRSSSQAIAEGLNE
ncbi:MAG: hypothetical protein A2Z99_13160 [Treponema sp. GWB1_62_6]|nr:MAG: hypothetical protein A2Z99_13160 [Treponema sp. GWB1_62_6]